MNDTMEVTKAVERTTSTPFDVFADYPTYETKEGQQMSFVRFIKSRWLLSWEHRREVGGHVDICLGVNANNVDIKTLEKLGVWSQMSSEVQEDLKKGHEADKNKVYTHMEKARAARKGREDLIGVPREVTCAKCGEVKPINPRTVLLQSGKAFKSVEDWCKEWQCASCSPRKRGRKANPEKQAMYAGIPTEATCTKCNKVQTMPPDQILKRAEKAGVKWNEWIKTYVCRTCNPMGGKRGRAPNPAYANFPKELICKCGNKMAVTPSGIAQRAKSKGMTPEKFIESYVCQVCNPTRGRKPKKGKKGKK